MKYFLQYPNITSWAPYTCVSMYTHAHAYVTLPMGSTVFTMPLLIGLTLFYILGVYCFLEVSTNIIIDLVTYVCTYIAHTIVN